MSLRDAEHSLTVSVRFLRPLLAELEACGVDVAPLIERAGIDPAVLKQPDARVSYAEACPLFRGSIEASHDRSLPIRATLRYRPEPNLFDYATMASATLGDALVRISRYAALMIDGFDLVLERGPRSSRMVYRSRHALTLPDAMMEYVVGVGAAASRHWVGVPFPVRCEFRHAAPDDPSAHKQVFAGGVEFGCRETAIVFPTAALDVKLPEADPEMSATLDARATAALSRAQRATPSLTTRVRDAMLVVLDQGEPTLEVLAERLKMSARTLRRRLREEGTTHRELLDGLRRELARHWLAQPGAQIDDVALRLGFADSTSFFRAFRRWEGKTPAQYMRECGS